MPDPPAAIPLETQLLDLIRDAGLPPPDEIVRDDPAEVLLLWHERKLAVVLELSDETEDFAAAADAADAAARASSRAAAPASSRAAAPTSSRAAADDAAAPAPSRAAGDPAPSNAPH
jgi:hypothetical protein